MWSGSWRPVRELALPSEGARPRVNWSVRESVASLHTQQRHATRSAVLCDTAGAAVRGDTGTDGVCSAHCEELPSAVTDGVPRSQPSEAEKEAAPEHGAWKGRNMA